METSARRGGSHHLYLRRSTDNTCSSGDLDGACKRQSRSTLSPSYDMPERYPHGLQVEIKP